MIDVRCALGFHDLPPPTTPDDDGGRIRCLRCGRFVGWWDNFKAGMILGLALSCMLWLLAGCACGVRDPRDGGGDGSPSAAAELARLGQWAVWCGGAVLGLGAILRIGRIAAIAATFAAPVLGLLGVATTSAGIAEVAAILTEAGGTALACGLAALWLADHFWIFLGACIVAAVAFAFRNRNRIRRWLRLGPNPDGKDKVTP